MEKVIPTNTQYTTYMRLNNNIYGLTKNKKGLYILKIVHTWGDGEIMKFDNYDELNPKSVHIVCVLNEKPSKNIIKKKVLEFEKKYFKSNKDQGEIR